jgi:hypothetical protein
MQIILYSKLIVILSLEYRLDLYYEQIYWHKIKEIQSVLHTNRNECRI